MGLPALAFCGFETSAPGLKFMRHPKNLTTIGEHVKKKRIDLRLLQKEVAERIGVSEDCITLWENNRSIPQVKFMPKIIQFLEYIPVKINTETLGGKVKAYRYLKGLSHKKFGKLLGVDASSVSAWESNKSSPREATLKLLQTYLTK